MPPNTTDQSSRLSLQRLQKTLNIAGHILTCPHFTTFVGYLILILDCFLSIFVIHRVKYTEIDWSTYMQQASLFVNGTLEYSSIKGSTGPCVYPAGHLYLYSIFYFLTNEGNSIIKAQYIFLLIYLANGLMVVWMYRRVLKVPPYVLVLLFFTSYRVHSIFLLRLFNDVIAITLFHFSLLMFMKRRWTFGCILFSLAVSIKMNILLFAPGVFLILMENLSFTSVLGCLSWCASIQLILGIPFLLHSPWSYLRGAFDLSRIFLFKWTVNWRFLPEEIFLSRYFHASLLVMHLMLLVLVFRERWITLCKKLWSDVRGGRPHHQREVIGEKTRVKGNDGLDSSMATSLHGQQVAYTLFLSNFIGILCSRSLHYQFYVWYFYSIPFLLWSTPFNTLFRLLMMAVIEWSWNTYPSTNLSSVLLLSSHIVILIGMTFSSGHCVIQEGDICSAKQSTSKQTTKKHE